MKAEAVPLAGLSLLLGAFAGVLCAVLLGLPLPLHGQEKIVLATPVYVTTGADFRPSSLVLKRTHPDRQAEVIATFSEVSGTTFVSNGKQLVCRYVGDEAETLIIALNKVNLATTSLEKRVMQKCQSDGKLAAGTISGSPQ